jgi:hypothetical protein
MHGIGERGNGERLPQQFVPNHVAAFALPDVAGDEQNREVVALALEMAD